MERGKFIVFYGINNLGKSTQAKRLIERLQANGIQAEYLKYGIYDLAPSGPLLNGYLRKGNPHGFSPREFQIMHVLNRTQYEPTLKEKLNAGVWIVAEDYSNTGIAWGVGAGVDKEFLVDLNQHLLKEDLSLFFHGERFMSSVESGHTHEENNELTATVARMHVELAQQYGWKSICANQSVDEVSADVWKEIVPFLHENSS